MTTHILIRVAGGLVADVFSSDPTVQVYVDDFDDLEHEDEDILASFLDDGTLVWEDQPDGTRALVANPARYPYTVY